MTRTLAHWADNTPVSWATLGCLLLMAGAPYMPSEAATAATPQPAAVAQRTFATAEQAVEALVSAAEKFDVPTLLEILGPDGRDLVISEDEVHDKNQAATFAEQARVKTVISQDPDRPGVSIVVLGDQDWPAPIPLVEENGRWRFDSKSGLEEALYRRIGANELNAIRFCEGYVEAQYEYAARKHDGASVNQYAQRVVSTSGRQDGLAWRSADGSWEGPVGEGVAGVIEDGFTDRSEPFHGYYFKILSGQGPAAPMGEMDFVLGGVMIGGFALAAAPADYAVTGVKTFIVSNSGVVYERDVGPDSLQKFRAMDRYNPDDNWTPVFEP